MFPFLTLTYSEDNMFSNFTNILVLDFSLKMFKQRCQTVQDCSHCGFYYTVTGVSCPNSETASFVCYDPVKFKLCAVVNLNSQCVVVARSVHTAQGPAQTAFHEFDIGDV